MKHMSIIVGIVVVALVVAVAVVMGGKEQGEQTLGAVAKSTPSFMEKYTQTENAVLVDVRSPEEYASGHIDGAVNVNFYDPSFVDAMKQLGTDKSFFIYCRSGNRSGQAVALLTKEGLRVEDLKGGIGAHPELLK